jgi:hypothetical protein
LEELEVDLLKNRTGQPDAIKVKIYESLGRNLQVKRVSKKFTQLFAELDVNHDGVISAAELKPLAEKLAKEKGTSQTDLQRLFDHIDANHNGEISREEFEAFLIQVRSTLPSHLSSRLCRVGVSVGSDYIEVFLCLFPMHFKDLTICLFLSSPGPKSADNISPFSRCRSCQKVVWFDHSREEVSKKRSGR